nr:hypothetical protein [Tanacetum cinerariifolium]
MEQEDLQQAALDEALVPIADQVKIGSCNMRIDSTKNQKEATYQLTLDIIKQYSCYNAFLITVDVPQIYMQQFCRQTSAKRKEQMPYPRFTKLTINNFLSKHNNLSKRHGSFLHTIKYDSVLGKLKFMSKGEEHQKYGMSILDSMMNDAIRSFAYYVAYMALSTNTEVPKASKNKGKGAVGKKKPDTNVQKEKKKAAMKKKNVAPKRKRSRLTSDDNILLDPDEAVTDAEFEETKDEKIQLLIRRPTGVFNGREIPKEPTEEALDHSQKLKGIDTLSSAAQLVSDLIFLVDQAAQVLVLKMKPKIFPVTKKSKLMNIKLKKEKKEEQAGDKQPVDEQAGGGQAYVPNPEVGNHSSSLTLSFAEYGNQFINENPDVLVNDILKDRTEPKIQSMVDVPIHQADPIVQRTPLIDIVISIVTEKSTPTLPPTTQASEFDPSLKFEQRLSALEKKVDVSSKVDHAETLSSQEWKASFLMCSKRIQSIIFKSSSSSTSIDSFTEYELKNMIYDKMQHSGSFQEHHKHLDLYNVLIGLIILDEAIAKGVINPAKVLKKRRHDDKDEDPPTKSDKEKRGENKRILSHKKMIKLVHLRKCYLARSDKLDWMNLKGDKCPFDLRNKERIYASSLTKTKAGPKRQLFYISRKNPISVMKSSQGVVYMNKSNRKRLMQADELYKFSDGMLKLVRDTLHEILQNFMLGYNHAMPKRAWKKKDQKRTDEIVQMIGNLLLEKRIMRRKNVIELSSEKAECHVDWISPEYQDTANSRGKKETKAFNFHKMETEEVSDRYVAPCFINGLEAYDEENDVEPRVVLGRSFMHLTKGIADFGNGIITIYPELDPFLDSFGETEKIDDDWDLLLDDLEFGDVLEIEGVEIPPFSADGNEYSYPIEYLKISGMLARIAMNLPSQTEMLETGTSCLETTSFIQSLHRIDLLHWQKLSRLGKAIYNHSNGIKTT